MRGFKTFLFRKGQKRQQDANFEPFHRFLVYMVDSLDVDFMKCFFMNTDSIVRLVRYMFVLYYAENKLKNTLFSRKNDFNLNRSNWVK